MFFSSLLFVLLLLTQKVPLTPARPPEVGLFSPLHFQCT